MRFIKKISLCIALAIICGNINAIPHTTIALKNGSIINGDIVVQRIGKDITVQAENATLVIKPEDIVSRRQRNVKYEDLQREQKRWVLENKALIGDSYGRYAVLEDIKTKKYTYSGLINKLDEGKPSNTYVQVVPVKFNLKWNDILQISKNTSIDIKYDLIDEVITTKGDVYKGKVISQKPGDGLTIETDKGLARLSNKEIKELRKHKRKGSGSYFSQLDYLNKITLIGGVEKEGIIILNHYGTKSKDNYLTLQKKNGECENILVSKIAELKTIYNYSEAPVYAPDKVYLNEFKIEKALLSRQKDNVIFLDKKVFPFPDGINITFKSEGTKFLGNWMLVSLSEMEFDNGQTTWGYKISKKGEETIPIDSKDYQASTSNITYGYLSPGFYALVNDDDSEGYVFKITK